ncbi:MAG: hypothetical protein R3F11_21705 [Verrucomicrobiales bacterium]
MARPAQKTAGPLSANISQFGDDPASSRRNRLARQQHVAHRDHKNWQRKCRRDPKAPPHVPQLRIIVLRQVRARHQIAARLFPKPSRTSGTRPACRSPRPGHIGQKYAAPTGGATGSWSPPWQQQEWGFAVGHE